MTRTSLSQACFHGGESWNAIGNGSDALDNFDRVINADVLDAWFPPSPKVIQSLSEHLCRLISTSPPTHSHGLIQEIAAARDIRSESIVVGAGSSDLIHRLLPILCGQSSSAAVLDPTYPEYAHVLRNILGCRVFCIPLSLELGFPVGETELSAALAQRPNLVVIVNPNNPTGTYVPSDVLCDWLVGVPSDTTVWIDETYIDYVSPDDSMERFAASSSNVIVCKSLSKCFSLSGARVAYAVCAPALAERVRRLTPPWAVSLPAQVAAVASLQDPEYFRARWSETAELRAGLVRGLEERAHLKVVGGAGNFVLALAGGAHAPTAASICEQARKDNLFLRDASRTSHILPPQALRIAVKDESTNRRIVEILASMRSEHEDDRTLEQATGWQALPELFLG